MTIGFRINSGLQLYEAKNVHLSGRNGARMDGIDNVTDYTSGRDVAVIEVSMFYDNAINGCENDDRIFYVDEPVLVNNKWIYREDIEE